MNSFRELPRILYIMMKIVKIYSHDSHLSTKFEIKDTLSTIN